MQELDHQYFFMQVFKMSCCEGRLEANILTNKCIIWGGLGLEPRSLAWIESVLQSKSTPDQHQTPGISTRQGVKLENSSGILNIHETFFEHFVHYFIFLITIIIQHHSSPARVIIIFWSLLMSCQWLWWPPAHMIPGRGSGPNWARAAVHLALSAWPRSTHRALISPDRGRCRHRHERGRNGQSERLRDFIKIKRPWSCAVSGIKIINSSQLGWEWHLERGLVN